VESLVDAPHEKAQRRERWKANAVRVSDLCQLPSIDREMEAMSDAKLSSNERVAFEAWMRSSGLESEWQEERNCYKDFTAHYAWQAWRHRAAAEPADVYVMKPSEAAVFEKVSRQRRVITPVFELCNAYESGIGHGLQKDDAVNPYPPRTQNAEAYQIGYEEGARRASLPPSDDLAVDVAGALERIRVKETLVEVYLMAHGRTDNPAYWAGFETACDEIAVRLQEQYGEEMTAAEAWVCSSVTKSESL
jgi:hypothetical protein